MRLRLGFAGLVCLASWGCNEPPEIGPMTPPGVTFPRVVDEGSEALGEKLSQGTVQPSNVAPGGAPPRKRPQTEPSAGEPTAPPADPAKAAAPPG